MVEYFLGGICMSAAVITGWENIYQDKTILKKASLYIVLILQAIALAINYKASINFLKFIISITLMVIANKIIFKKTIKDTIISVTSTEIVGIISEIIFGLGILAFSKVSTSERIISTYFGSFATNAIISLFMYIMTVFNMPLIIYRRIIKNTGHLHYKQFFPLTFILILSINILFFSIYNDIPLIILMPLNCTIMAIYGYIMLKITNEQSEKLKTFEKYKKTAESLNEYQDAVNKYRVDRHENKNQLKTIEKLAIRTNNQEILEYVQVLLDKKNQNKPQVKMENIVIPDGWLKTTLYAKMEAMEEKEIKYNLRIDKLVKTTDLIDIDESTMLDICNILNIFIDNAIEATPLTPKSYIKIHFYKEKSQDLNISVMNSCNNIIDIGKIGKMGYSNKGDGRGYGLAFVKETIRGNHRLSNEKIVKVGSFTQILKIKM